jgi:hypothetical protein
VRITIYDQGGRILTDTFTTALGAGPMLAAFTALVPFNVSTQQNGCIRVFETSPADGSLRNVVQAEVILVPPTRPPTTGEAGLARADGSMPFERVEALLAVLTTASILALVVRSKQRKPRTRECRT